MRRRGAACLVASSVIPSNLVRPSLVSCQGASCILREGPASAFYAFPNNASDAPFELRCATMPFFSWECLRFTWFDHGDTRVGGGNNVLGQSDLAVLIGWWWDVLRRESYLLSSIGVAVGSDRSTKGGLALLGSIWRNVVCCVRDICKSIKKPKLWTGVALLLFAVSSAHYGLLVYHCSWTVLDCCPVMIKGGPSYRLVLLHGPIVVFVVTWGWITCMEVRRDEWRVRYAIG